MSTDEDISAFCANCGKGEGADLKACTACKMVKYCNRDCQIAHRPQHKKECTNRAAELHDEKLFNQPPPNNEDCPICMLPIPAFDCGSIYYSCCGKEICSGCIYAVTERDMAEQKCAFCRTPAPDTGEELVKRIRKRVERNDAFANGILGSFYFHGAYGLTQDKINALKLYHRAGELGHAKSYHNVGNAYYNGEGWRGVTPIDTKKANHFWELAAIGGDVVARHNLGASEANNGNMNRALKHHMIAVEGGWDVSLNAIRKMYTEGQATKDDYSKALRLYQAYLDEIRSDQRDKAMANGDDFIYY